MRNKILIFTTIVIAAILILGLAKLLSPKPPQTSNSATPTPPPTGGLAPTSAPVQAPLPTPAPTPAQTPTEKIGFAARIQQSLAKGATVQEIANPKLALPSGIVEGQIKKYFKLDNLLFALVLRNSVNVVLNLPQDFTPSFAGVLAAAQGDAQWTKLAEIKDGPASEKNNPYYLLVDGQKLFVTVVDHNGAGSGEGLMKVFRLTPKNIWELAGCYYFGGNYNDVATSGDYFAFSAKLSKQSPQPLKSCQNVQLISQGV